VLSNLPDYTPGVQQGTAKLLAEQVGVQTNQVQLLTPSFPVTSEVTVTGACVTPTTASPAAAQPLIPCWFSPAAWLSTWVRNQHQCLLRLPLASLQVCLLGTTAM
jgi:hypothetical protein